MKQLLLLMAVVAAMAGCAAERTARLAAELDGIFQPLFPEDGPGAAVLVVRDGKLVYDSCFGLADLETKAPVTDSTMFNICSVSKQFSAVALLKLAEQGKLSLNDPVSRYFPQWRAPFFRQITLAHLLSHSSGIPDARPRTEAEWADYRSRHDSQFATVAEFRRFCEEDESLRYLESLQALHFEPGTAYEYMNPTYQMVLPIVEQVTGERFDDWMQANVFLPAGMTQTLYFTPDAVIPDMAHGYSRGGDGAWHEDDYGEANFFGTKADGGIYTTPQQFVAWDEALFHDRVMRPESRLEAHTGRIATDIPDTDYGYGWFIEHRPGRPEKIYHTGDNGGFLIFEGRYPSRDLFYLIFATHPHWDRDATVEAVDQAFARAGWL